MMLTAVETVTNADPVWESRRHNSDAAAQATARESVHAAMVSQPILDELGLTGELRQLT